MKIFGFDTKPAVVETLIIPRGEINLVFKLRAVLDFEDFYAMAPRPVAPFKILPGNRKVEDRENPEYLEAIAKHARMQTNWTIIKSLSATEGLKWDTVNLSDPETWQNVMPELEASLRDSEAALIVQKVVEVCGMSADRIEKATKDFLAGLLDHNSVLTSQNSEVLNTRSGEPVKDLESHLPE